MKEQVCEIGFGTACHPSVCPSAARLCQHTHTHTQNRERDTHKQRDETREQKNKNRDASFTHKSKHLHQCVDINSFNTHTHTRWLLKTCDLGSLQAIDWIRSQRNPRRTLVHKDRQGGIEKVEY